MESHFSCLVASIFLPLYIKMEGEKPLTFELDSNLEYLPSKQALCPSHRCCLLDLSLPEHISRWSFWAAAWRHRVHLWRRQPERRRRGHEAVQRDIVTSSTFTLHQVHHGLLGLWPAAIARKDYSNLKISYSSMVYRRFYASTALSRRLLALIWVSSLHCV